MAITTRRDIEGTLARWFAIDADSHIGIFTGPYAAWPASVFDDYGAVEAACELVASASATTEAVLSPSWVGSPRFPALEASRGFFSFDSDPGYGGSTVYVRDASPAVPLREADADPIVRRAAGLVRFPTIRFAEADRVDLRGLVRVVVGDG